MSATDVKVDMPPCEDVKSNVTISPERRARVRKALVKKLRSTSSFVVAINRLANPTSSVAAFASWDAPKPAAEHEEVRRAPQRPPRFACAGVPRALCPN